MDETTNPEMDECMDADMHGWMTGVMDLFNRFAHSAGPGREPQRVEAVWRAVDGLMHRSKWQSRSGIWEKSNSERRGKREERREMLRSQKGGMVEKRVGP